MSKFLSYQDIHPKLSLLNDNYDAILKEYRINFDKLEFRDFTEQQNNYIQKQNRR